MRKLYLLSLILFLSLSCFAQQNLSSPVFLITSLNNCHDEEAMRNVFKYYAFTVLPDQDGYMVYTYKDGTTFQCRMDSITPRLKAPEIKIKTKESKKNLNRILRELGFVKQDGKYVKGSPHTKSQTVCTLEPTGLTVRRIYKQNQ